MVDGDAVIAAAMRRMESHDQLAFVASEQIVADLAGPTSKIGGHPWWPERAPWPTGAAVSRPISESDTPDWSDPQPGSELPLRFVGQLNFADLRFDALDEADLSIAASARELARFPRDGLLQLFVDEEPPWGLDFEIPDALPGWRLVHWPADTLDGAVTPAEAAPAFVSEDFPVCLQPGTCLELQFELGLTSDFAAVLRTLDDLDKELTSDEERLAFVEITARADSFYQSTPPPMQIGGHPHFEQTDPRVDGGPQLLLVQFGTGGWTAEDPGHGVMWADGGAAQIFVESPEVSGWGSPRYHWDCG
jgi:uncharacterized protein YwqG